MESPELPDFNFDTLSEADVREEVIAPILRLLGYRSGTENTVLRERAIELRYPNMFLGRKKPDKDPVLRGRPDYICDARNIARWVIEAKPPSEEIGQDDIEQAHSYAVHPELAAPLFVLSNGREWLVFESNRGPAVDPMLRLSYQEIRERFYVLHNLLSPSALNRRYPVQVADFGRPLANGFGSNARITGGFTRYDSFDTEIEGLPSGVSVPDLNSGKRLIGYQAAIIGETCYRSDQLGIVADIRMHHPHETMRSFAELTGLARNQYSTRAATVSESPDNPTVFEFTHHCTIPAGTKLFNMLTWNEDVCPLSVNMVVYAEAIGHLAGSSFHGTYSARLLSEPLGGVFQVRQWTYLRGTFVVELAQM